jgi:hypothetical protein
MRSAIIIGLGLLVLCAGHGLSDAEAPPKKPTQPAATGQTGAKWEYKTMARVAIEQLGNKDFSVGLNKLGDEGWELVSCSSSVGPVQEFYFKRPRSRSVTEGGKTGGPPVAETRNEDYEIVKLKFVAAVDLAQTADAIFGKDANLRIVADPATNSLLVHGSPKQIEDVRRLIISLDVQDAVIGDVVTRTFVQRLKYARAGDMLKLLQEVYGKDPKTYRAGADERTNTLVVSGSQKQLEDMLRLIKELDVPGPKDGAESKVPPNLPPSRN